MSEPDFRSERLRQWQVATGWTDPEERLAACLALADAEVAARHGGLEGEVRLGFGEEPWVSISREGVLLVQGHIRTPDIGRIHGKDRP